MKKIKILFLIHDLGQGGAEKVLVNLVNNMDREKFDIHVTTIFGGGVNEQFLKKDIKYKTVFSRSIPGNSKIMKLFTPKQLHRLCVKEHYDIEVSYLEGPAARVISGCQNKDTKLVSWIHVEQHNMNKLKRSFKSENEAIDCYNRFNKIICVSNTVKYDFCKILSFKNSCEVLYNTVESEKIKGLSRDKENALSTECCKKIIAVGTLKKSKGYIRLFNIVKRLKMENIQVHLYVLGIGPQESELKEYINANDLEDRVTLLGYDTNPYKYVSKCDLFVCSSYAEGFSTAATEALIVGTPVCTVEVSGMKEMLGENNEYGVVTENSEDALYEGIKNLLDNPEKLKHYKKKAAERGNTFSTENTVKAAEDMFIELMEDKNA